MAGDPVGRPLPVLPQALGHGDGPSPCTANACRACCFDTEMPLLAADVARLEARTGRPREWFSLLDDPEHEDARPHSEGGGRNGSETGRRLRNRDGRCVFLDASGCTVYDDRPAGCRLYPLVWDEAAGSGRLDEECPYRSGFRVRPRDRAALRDVVDRLLPQGA